MIPHTPAYISRPAHPRPPGYRHAHNPRSPAQTRATLEWANSDAPSPKYVPPQVLLVFADPRQSRRRRKACPHPSTTKVPQPSSPASPRIYEVIDDYSCALSPCRQIALTSRLHTLYNNEPPPPFVAHPHSPAYGSFQDIRACARRVCSSCCLVSPSRLFRPQRSFDRVKINGRSGNRQRREAWAVRVASRLLDLWARVRAVPWRVSRSWGDVMRAPGGSSRTLRPSPCTGTVLVSATQGVVWRAYATLQGCAPPEAEERARGARA